MQRVGRYWVLEDGCNVMKGERDMQVVTEVCVEDKCRVVRGEKVVSGGDAVT
jgi:hypothetical protein